MLGALTEKDAAYENQACACEVVCGGWDTRNLRECVAAEETAYYQEYDERQESHASHDGAVTLGFFSFVGKTGIGVIIPVSAGRIGVGSIWERRRRPRRRLWQLAQLRQKLRTVGVVTCKHE